MLKTQDPIEPKIDPTPMLWDVVMGVVPVCFQHDHKMYDTCTRKSFEQ